MSASVPPVPAADAASAAADAVRIDVLRGEPTAQELAAVMAVVSEAYSREAADAIAEESPRRSAWELSARGVRTPLQRDIGWGRFAG
ncbi:acyl-CoA carboxylase subunit epsilon [Microbacterium sp. VKM Ac-2870]|uniref:acyl-CoA carboxylase subunit epsilon n=1 Tax=Microbacterium sp. VKM Ac-2870 TaxID=2783825 RepID=UPI00188A7854|nr:acyl-CoA carboxylase subunit epsilon [Microbacterium sp. VKM Ac-2870]MBF4561653.1 acyl-CoA carboxylase subunit epsilon [Microbacterium sp. VKM Ac-2870]